MSEYWKWFAFGVLSATGAIALTYGVVWQGRREGWRAMRQRIFGWPQTLHILMYFLGFLFGGIYALRGGGYWWLAFIVGPALVGVTTPSGKKP